MKKSRKINKENVKSLVATLNLYVDILFAEPTKSMETIKIKSKYIRVIAGSFRNKTKGFGADRKFRSQQVKRSNIRLVIIIAALIAIGYYVLNQNLSGLSVWLDALSN